MSSNEDDLDEYVKTVWNRCVNIYNLYGPLRFRRETIILLDLIPWFASVSTFSIISILSFSLYICLLFLYPTIRGMEISSKKLIYNIVLSILKTIGLVMFISYQPSFWLLTWIYFTSLTQIMNSLRWRADSTFVYGRIPIKDEALTFPLPFLQFSIVCIALARSLLRNTQTPFWSLVVLFQWLLYLAILFVITVPLLEFYLGVDIPSRNHKHKNDLLFEIQTALIIFVGFCWIASEVFGIVAILTPCIVIAIQWLRDHRINTYQSLKNENWVARLYDYFDADVLVRRDKECVVCMENFVNTVLTPCGHICVCYQCSERLKPLNCPICKFSIQKVIRTFDATYSKLN